ncbi:protein unc-93 homolog A-like [Clavelina lepadiformis]|uniref:protein unc-93 homolog A-like n=1 Tax=Clavelina lepadiformis TaxID=159417 RepID=UPI004042854B
MSSTASLRRQIVIKFAIFTSGIFLTFAGYLVLLGLQSSINIEDGVGNASVTATYVTASLFGVTLTPLILKRFGKKACVLFCEFTYLVYILVNYYPESYTLIPAGVIVGMGEATMWPAMMLFVVHYARRFARHGTKSTERYTTEFIGLFYCAFQFSGVFGNLINYAILYGGSSNASSDTSARELSYCGINDCQVPNITAQYLNQYVPASQTLLYIMIGVMAGLVLLAMLIHSTLVRDIDQSLEVEDKGNENPPDDDVSNHDDGAWQFITRTFMGTLLHLINPKQLLITPFALYSGFFMAFGFTEVSRAFGSCMLGVEQVGLMLAVTGAADSLMSFVSGRISGRFGRNFTFIVGFFLDISNYMICLFWVPSQSSLWVVYIIFAMVGLIDGVWQPLVNEMHGAYFPENEEVAFTVWNMYTLVGIAWQTGWSSSLCVSTKIYVQIAFLCFSMICHRVSVWIYYRKSPKYDELNVVENKGTAF